MTKKNINKRKSYRPAKVTPDAYGNKKTNSISYSKKKTQINKNWIGNLTGFCVWGLKPHS